MKRIATALAVAALAVGASAATASARVCCDDPGDAVGTLAPVTAAQKPAKKVVKKTTTTKTLHYADGRWYHADGTPVL